MRHNMLARKSRDPLDAGGGVPQQRKKKKNHAKNPRQSHSQPQKVSSAFQPLATTIDDDPSYKSHEDVVRVSDDGENHPYEGEQTFEDRYQPSPYIAEHPDAVVMSWMGPEYEVYPKSGRWYTAMGLLLAVIAVYAVLTNSPIMAIVFILIGLVGYLYLNTPPRVLEFGIVADGIVAGGHLFHFDEIESFWIFYDPPHTRVISLHMKGRMIPYVHVPLHQLDPVDVRAALMQFVPERRQEQNLIDTLERVLHI